MYSLDCEHYNREYATLGELIQNIMDSGQDPSYEILHDGEHTGEKAQDYLEF